MNAMDNFPGQPPPGARRVAFFGGSFDPPHLGHLAVARAAQEALGLDAVLFAPVGAQPLKPRGSTAAFVHRAAMTQLAIAGDPGFSLSLADEPKPSGEPNYTLDTLLRLRDELPAGSALYCLMGADSLAGLSHWHRAAEIPFAAPLIVASRPSQSRWRLADLSATLPAGLTIEALPQPDSATGLSGDFPPLPSAFPREILLRRYILRNSTGDCAPFYLLPGLHIQISASAIRRRILADRESQPPGPELLPEAVTNYIRAHGLYRSLAAAPTRG
jgi:nicotinate-nucleotide adenylyltransferase